MPHNAHIMLVVSKYYKEISEQLLAGSIEELKKNESTWEILEVPGAFEIPAAISMSINSNKELKSSNPIDGYVALGCVIRGATDHYDHICREVSRELMELTVKQSMPHGFGILTCENYEQAWERADIKDRDVGGRAALACCRMLTVFKKINDGSV